MPLKKLALIIGVSVFVFVGAVPASAAPICLKTYMIDSTKTVDSKTIDFRMKDGKVYRNTLRTSCPGLKFNGFVYKTRTGEICGNLQSIRVLRTHEVCMLGAFSELPAAKPESAHQNVEHEIDEYVITNKHVVNRGDKILVTLSDRRQLEAKLVAADAQTDIAVLKVTSDKLSALPIGDSKDLAAGDHVVGLVSLLAHPHTNRSRQSTMTNPLQRQIFDSNQIGETGKRTLSYLD